MNKSRKKEYKRTKLYVKEYNTIRKEETKAGPDTVVQWVKSQPVKPASPIRALVQVLLIPLPNHLFANVPDKATESGPST